MNVNVSFSYTPGPAHPLIQRLYSINVGGRDESPPSTYSRSFYSAI